MEKDGSVKSAPCHQSLPFICKVDMNNATYDSHCDVYATGNIITICLFYLLMDVVVTKLKFKIYLETKFKKEFYVHVCIWKKLSSVW